MKQFTPNRLLNIPATCAALMILLGCIQGCSKKSASSKSAVTTAGEPARIAAPSAEEKDGMQIKRDAAGNYVIQLVIVNLEPVKLMKPVKEGYVVWMVNESGVTSNIGTIEGANTWTTRKDKSRFEATSAVKPTKVFISAETDLNAQKPGTQVVWSTGNF